MERIQGQIRCSQISDYLVSHFLLDTVLQGCRPCGLDSVSGYCEPKARTVAVSDPLGRFRSSAVA